MLRVVYEATDLTPGVISDWSEDRGLLRIRVDRQATPDQFTESLNRTMLDVLDNTGWYQLWRGEIISIASPNNPLRVDHQISSLTPAPLVEIRERKGTVTLSVSPTASAEEFVQAVNPSLEELLAGGQWFQHWKGEIVTMESAEVALA
ncbi:hypothetical protein [Streptomyces sp. NPDC059802]|uniref:hypothetical protein n=1 Tax=Streptomyces sp. NPDC059802 TaxID=3346952 RepID=UPI00365C8FE0